MKNAKTEVLKASAELVNLGLVARTWGNVSCRIDENYIAITPSGIGYDRLNENNIVIVNIDTMKYEGTIKPSSEKGVHAAAYKLDPHTNFVIHTHQTYATCIGVSGFSSLQPTEEELSILGGEIGLCSYGISGTKKLTRIVADEMAAGKHAILMAKHGAVLTGLNRIETFKRSSLLEKICKRAMPALPAFNDSPTKPNEMSKNIISMIRSKYPDFNSIMVLTSDAINMVMEKGGKLPAVLDDFAQMVGADIKTSTIHNAVKNLKGRNAVYVKGIGALCCAEDESDCRAVLTLVEKNALTFLNAEMNGCSPELSVIDRKLMRFVYKKNYSKRK